MEVSKSEVRFLSERFRQITTDLRVSNIYRRAFSGRFARLEIENESALIAGEAVGGNRSDSDGREKRRDSSNQVVKNDDGDSDGDSEPDSRSKSRKARAHISFPTLELETRTTITTEAAAYYLNRKPQTLRAWACLENGPIRPVRINGRLAWPVARIRLLQSGEGA